MHGFWLSGAWGAQVLQTAPLYLPPNWRAWPCESTCSPYHTSWLWLLPAVVQKVGLSLWGANTKKINRWMLPEELGAGEVVGAKGVF